MGLFSKRVQPVAQKSYTTYQLMPRVGWTAKWSPFSQQKAVKQGFRRSSWVYTCVRTRAANIAAVPWIVEVERNGEWEPADDHPLTRLLANPNPSYDLSMMVRQWVYSLDLTGDAYATRTRNGAGETREIWPIIPDRMEILPSTEQMISAYRYHKNSVTRTIPTEDIVHLRYANPGDLYYGLAPLEAAARAVDIDEEAERWQKTMLQNLGVPPVVFSMQGESIGQQEYDQAKQWVAEQSGGDNARRPWVVANATVQSISQSAVDLDMINGRRMTREEICAVFAVPPPIVGIYDKATLANIETARKIMWLEGLIPTLNEIKGQLNIQLAGDYQERLRIRYDLSNVEALQDNVGDQIKAAEQLWRMGVPLAEINQRLELGLDTDNIPGADTGYLGSGLLPTDFDFGDDNEPEPGGDEAAETAFGSGATDKVQDTALNGAQIGAIQSIVQAVANNELPAETAVQLIRVSFPTIDEDQARRIIDPADGFTVEDIDGAATE